MMSSSSWIALVAVAIVTIPLWILFSPLLALVALVVYFFFLRELPAKHVPARSLKVGSNLVNAGAPNLIESIFDGCRTLDGQFRLAVEAYGSAPCLGTRQELGASQVKKTVTVEGKAVEKTFNVVQKSRAVTWQTFSEVYADVRALGAALADTGLKSGQPLSLYSDTRLEWQKTAQACFAFGFPVVTAYASLGEDALIFSFNQTKCSHVVTNAKVRAKHANSGKDLLRASTRI